MRRKFAAAAVFALLALLASPLVPLVIWSVAVKWPWPHLLPESFSLSGWEFALDPDSGFIAGIGQSFVIASFVTIIALVVSLPLARLLGLHSFPGKSFVEVLVLLPLLLPAFVSAMGLHETFLRWNLTETVSGVVLIHLVPTMPYMLRALTAGFSTIGTRLEDQARTLGASPLRVALSVTLPRMVPAMLAGATFTFLTSLGDYLLTLLIGGGVVETLPLILFPYITAGDRTLAAVGSLILALCPLATLLLLEIVSTRLVPLRRTFGARMQCS